MFAYLIAGFCMALTVLGACKEIARIRQNEKIAAWEKRKAELLATN
jgi:hypothetical protein